MTKQKQVFDQVTAYEKKNPGVARTAVFKKLKVMPSAYYKHARMMKAAKPKPVKKRATRKYSKQVVSGTTPSAITPSQVTVIMGTPDQIRAVLQ